MNQPAIDVPGLVREGLEKDLEIRHPDRKPQRRTYCYASGYHPCSRNLALQMRRPEMKEAFSVETKAHFDRGNDSEARVMHWINGAGRFSTPNFHTSGEQERLEIKDREGNVVIVGRKDFDLVVGEHGNQSIYPCEVKDWRTMHQHVETAGDLSNSPWTRKALYQLLAYLYGSDTPLGYLVLITPTFPKFIPLVLDELLGEMEDFLQKAEPACVYAREDEAALREGEAILPDMIDDPSECRRCEFFGTACLPDMKMGDAAAVFTDHQVIQDVEREDELHESKKEYTRLHKLNADRFRHSVEAFAICGDKLIKATRTERKSYKVPKEIKEQYLEMGESFGFTISDLKK